MSAGNTRDQGNKSSNTPYQLRNLQISAATATSALSRVYQEEKPSVIYSFVGGDGNDVTTLCYTNKNGALVTDPNWKLKYISDDGAGLVQIFYYEDKEYDNVLDAGGGVSVNLEAIYNAGTDLVFMKDI